MPCRTHSSVPGVICPRSGTRTASTRGFTASSFDRVSTRRAGPGAIASTLFWTSPRRRQRPATNGGDIQKLLGERPEEYAYQGLELSPNGRTLTYWRYEAVPESSDTQARIHLVDLATGMDRVMRFDTSAGGESQLGFSPDGRTAVIVRQDTRVQLLVASLDQATPVRPVGPTYTGREQLTTMFSPDGTKFVLAFETPQEPVLVDLATGTPTTLGGMWSSYASWQRLAPSSAGLPVDEPDPESWGGRRRWPAGRARMRPWPTA